MKLWNVIGFLVLTLISVNISYAEKKGLVDFTLEGFPNNGIVKLTHTCQSGGGDNAAPHIAWTKSPEGTKYFGFILLDPDSPSGTFYHWVLASIPVELGKLLGNTKLPDGIAEYRNSYDRLGYMGPCPPSGQMHRYVARLYALKEKIEVARVGSVQELDDLLLTESIGYGEIIAKWGS